jgi:Holliday junction DNA helicase RuvA
MIAHIRGQLFSKQPSQAIVEAGGVGYDVAISVPTYSALPAEGAEVALHIYTQVREDALALYGFAERGEKQLFERLITVTGVGPRLALTILSGLSTDRTIAAIRAQDHAMLTRIPGVGKRLAERLVVELKDKLDALALPAPTPQHAGAAAADVLSALVNLGYQRAAAQKALETAVAKDKAAGDDFDTLFRASLLLIR